MAWIRCCCSCDVGLGCSLGMVPGPGTSKYCRWGQKKKKRSCIHWSKQDDSLPFQAAALTRFCLSIPMVHAYPNAYLQCHLQAYHVLICLCAHMPAISVLSSLCALCTYIPISTFAGSPSPADYDYSVQVPSVSLS